MIPASRPLRAAGAVMGSWIALRTVMLMGSQPVALASIEADDAVSPVPLSESALEPVPSTAAPAPQAPVMPVTGVYLGATPDRHHLPSLTIPTATTFSSGHATPAITLSPALPVPQTSVLDVAASPPPLPGTTPPPGFQSTPRNRLQLSGWALVRSAASAGGLAPGGTLGGSQVGARGWFEPGPPGLALTARVSSPLATRTGSEASVGVGFRKGNFGVIVEERFSLDAGGGARPSVTVFGGVSEVRLRGKLRLDAYAQAGIVGLRNRVGFADGALRVEHPVISKPLRLSLGAGAWGGVQPGLSRLDIGPQIVARLPVLGGNLRVAGEWRFRVAGSADPGSGPTLSIGADF